MNENLSDLHSPSMIPSAGETAGHHKPQMLMPEKFLPLLAWQVQAY